MRYRYAAIDPKGQKLRGDLEAGNPEHLESLLKQMGLELLHSHPLSPLALVLTPRIPRRELINLCFQLEQLLQASVPILEALTDLRDSLEHPGLQAVLTQLAENIRGGQTLSQALGAHSTLFNPVFVSLIRAGETSGNLGSVLKQLTASLKWEDELLSQTRRLLLYPAFVGLVILATVTFLMVYLVPQLKLFILNMGHTLPLHTRALFLISGLLLDYGYLLLMSIPILGFGTYQLILHHPPARFHLDAMKLRLPLVGSTLQKIILARFASTLGMLYGAGIPILEALLVTRNVLGNQLLENALDQAEQAIREGRQMAAAFQDTGLFPPLVVRMIRVGESTGGLDRALLNVSYFYNRDVQEAVSRAQALVEPLLTLTLGLLLGWIILAVIGPLYDVVSQVGI